MLWIIAVALVTGGTAVANAPVKGTVFLDPGHGGTDSGAILRDAQGRVILQEKDVNLAVALKTAELLRARGYQVILSRETDQRPGAGRDVNGDGRVGRRDALQAVVDRANESGADIFIALHSNSSPNPRASGVEVYYCADREFATESYRLAKLVRAHLLQALREIGYQAVDRGIKDDSVLFRWRARWRRHWQSDSRWQWRGHLFVLGPARSWGRWRVHPRATQMPGVLAEALFLTNAAEARLLASEEGQWALARGYAAAVEAYFESQDQGGSP
jgi:N-acetylmuramoyl-L-alanine amidase